MGILVFHFTVTLFPVTVTEMPGNRSLTLLLTNVDVVGQRRRESDDADEGLGALHHPQGSRHEGFHHGAAVAVQQVHLVDDELNEKEFTQ